MCFPSLLLFVRRLTSKGAALRRAPDPCQAQFHATVAPSVGVVTIAPFAPNGS